MRLQDYIPFYIGRPYVSSDENIPDGVVTGYSSNEGCDFVYLTFMDEGVLLTMPSNAFDVIRLVLRPLGYMTAAELKEIYGMPVLPEILRVRMHHKYVSWSYRYKHPDPERNNDDGYFYCEVGMSIRDSFKVSQVKFLLKQGFDMFGLLEAGLAEKEAIQKQEIFEQ